MYKKQKNVLILLGAVIIILLFIVLFWPRGNVGLLTPSGNSSVTNSQESAPQASATAAPVPANVTVPNEGDKNVSSSVAVPSLQTSAHPSGGASQYRQFNINTNNNEFTPATIAVNKGDIVDLEVSAVDKDYDFTQPDYGFSDLSVLPIKKGEITKVQFEAVTAGKFTFYCSSCGGPDKGPVGYIIVTDK